MAKYEELLSIVNESAALRPLTYKMLKHVVKGVENVSPKEAISMHSAHNFCELVRKLLTTTDSPPTTSMKMRSNPGKLADSPDRVCLLALWAKCNGM